jgi:hypothetical protein
VRVSLAIVRKTDEKTNIMTLRRLSPLLKCLSSLYLASANTCENLPELFYLTSRFYYEMTKIYEESATTSIAVIAIIAALAVLGTVMVMVAVTIPLHQQAEAAGCANGSHAFFQSKGSCFHP